MNLTAYRTAAFSEVFTFRDANGNAIRPPAGTYVVTLQNGGFVQQYGCRVQTNGVLWTMTQAQVSTLPYSTLYFTLTNNGAEVTRGVLNVR